MELHLIQHASKYPPTKDVKINIDTNEVVLGRHSDNAVCIKSVWISRQHAVIRRTTEGCYELHELKAVNGVYVNGAKLSPGAIITLSNNDEVQLGVKPTPSEPATLTSEYFVYRFTNDTGCSSAKRGLSPAHTPNAKCLKSVDDRGTSTADSTRKKVEEVMAAKKVQREAAEEAKSAAELAEREKAEAAERAVKAEREKAEEALRAEKAEKEKAEEALRAEKALLEKKALEQELAELRRLQNDQRDSMLAKEEALRREIVELQTKHESEVVGALREKEEQMEQSIKHIQDEEAKKAEEISKKLMESEKQLEEAKAHEKKLEALEEELKSTRDEQERLTKVSADLAVQERLTDLLEEQLQCSICSEVMIKPKNFPCSHTFCGYCIDKWVKQKRECPVCRARVTAATPNYLITSLIDKAVEQMSTENKYYRSSIIAARDVELAEKKRPKGKKGKQRAAARPPPAATTTTNPSTSRPAAQRAAANATSSQPSSSGTAASTAASSHSYHNVLAAHQQVTPSGTYRIPKVSHNTPPTHATPSARPINSWFGGAANQQPPTTRKHAATGPGTTVSSKSTPSEGTIPGHRPASTSVDSRRPAQGVSQPSASRYGVPVHHPGGRVGAGPPTQVRALSQPGSRQVRAPVPVPNQPISHSAQRPPQPACPSSTRPLRPVTGQVNPVNPLRLSSTQNMANINYHATIGSIMYRFAMPVGSKFPIAINPGDGWLHWVSPDANILTSGESPNGLRCSITSVTKLVPG